MKLLFISYMKQIAGPIYPVRFELFIKKDLDLLEINKRVWGEARKLQHKEKGQKESNGFARREN